MLKDRRATPAIEPYLKKYRIGIEKEAVTGMPDDVVFGAIPYHAYFSVCGALLSIEGSTEYGEAIRKYLEHLTFRCDGGRSTHWKLDAPAIPR